MSDETWYEVVAHDMEFAADVLFREAREANHTNIAESLRCVAGFLEYEADRTREEQGG